MKSILSIVAIAVMFSLTASRLFADEGKEVTLKGTVCCAKCEMHQTDKCQDALKVSENGKDVIYYISGPEAKSFHKQVCQGPKENVSVTGVVSEKDGQKWIKASKIE